MTTLRNTHINLSLLPGSSRTPSAPAPRAMAGGFTVSRFSLTATDTFTRRNTTPNLVAVLASGPATPSIRFVAPIRSFFEAPRPGGGAAGVGPGNAPAQPADNVPTQLAEAREQEAEARRRANDAYDRYWDARTAFDNNPTPQTIRELREAGRAHQEALGELERASEKRAELEDLARNPDLYLDAFRLAREEAERRARALWEALTRRPPSSRGVHGPEQRRSGSPLSLQVFRL